MVAVLLGLPFPVAVLIVLKFMDGQMGDLVKAQPLVGGACLLTLLAVVPVHELIHGLAYGQGIRSPHLVIGAWPSRGLVLVFSLLHAAMCGVDFIAFWRLVSQVPRNALVHNNGWQTYWSPSYSITIRLQYPDRAGQLGRITSVIGEADGFIGAVDIVDVRGSMITRDITVNTRNVEHSHRVVEQVGGHVWRDQSGGYFGTSLCGDRGAIDFPIGHPGLS